MIKSPAWTRRSRISCRRGISCTPEEIESVVSLAKANFEEGKEQTRRTIKAVWMRKRDARLEEERKAKEMRRRLRMRRGQPLGTVGVGEGDHFS